MARRSSRAAGWHVVEVKYGRRLQALFARPGGERAARAGSTRCPTSSTSRCSRCRRRACARGSSTARPRRSAPLVAGRRRRRARRAGAATSAATTSADCSQAFAECDAVTDRPSVVFAYTIKGWGLPIAGNPRNHSALLTAEQIDALRTAIGLTPDDRVGPLRPAPRRPGSWPPRGASTCTAPVAGRAAGAWRRPRPDRRSGPATPMSTQEAFGRVLVDLSRDAAVAPYLVTTAPDVATSTNLAGFINRIGVFTPDERRALERGPGAALGRGPQRAAHRAGHQRDEPVPAARPARPVLGPVRPAAAADRHRLRPVRAARPGRLHLRPLLRRPVHRRRHAVRGHAGARGRRAPVDHHPVGGPGAARA